MIVENFTIESTGQLTALKQFISTEMPSAQFRRTPIHNKGRNTYDVSLRYKTEDLGKIEVFHTQCNKQETKEQTKKPSLLQQFFSLF